ncbi:MAG: magnesium transporter [Firmicutes bacterium]|nr:magnesium transporter [Bacillota bacterium]NLL87784.1 magnesium transporter [Bacillota bacterium]
MDIKRIIALIEGKDFMQLKAVLLEEQVQDIAELIDELEPKSALLAFRLLPKDVAVDVFSYLNSETQVAISRLVNENELKEIVDELFFDDMIDFLEEMPANVVKRILLHTGESKRALINQFLNYPDDTVGSIMTIEFVDLRKEFTVEEALAKIRRIALEKETIYTCYVMDSERHLEGIVSLKDLVISDPQKKIEEIMWRDIISAATFDKSEEAAALMQKYNLLALPVTDHENRLVGIVTVDDIIDVIEEAATEDIHKMATVGDLDTSILHARPAQLLKSRLPWLLILVLVNILSGAGMSYFEATIQSVVALVFFLPLLIDSAGNAGAQSSALIIRSMAVGDVELSDWWGLLRKEMMVAVPLGAVLGAASYLIGIVRAGLGVAFVVATSMAVIVLAGSLVGLSLPFLLKKLKLDPATASGPLVTSICDIMGVMIYFSIASWYFGF